MSPARQVPAPIVGAGIGLLLLTVWFAVSAQSLAVTPPLAHCVLAKTPTGFSGTCGAVFQEKPVFTLAPSGAVASGIWRSDVHPTGVWTGTMSDNSGSYPAELETYGRGKGILRTEYGWFAVAHVALSSTLSFELDASREIRPEALDRRIVERASAILSSPSAWNRKDNRNCPAAASTWSIYCALQQATIEITGAANHRRPALEVVRTIVDERSAGRNYHHRLMDYNNDTSTRLEDVQSLFREALSGMADTKWLEKHGFAASSAL
jgi:hypothetical protein